MERVNAANLKRKTPSSWIVLEQTKQGKSLVSLKSNTRCASFTPGKVYEDDDDDDDDGDALSIEASERFRERTKGNLICRWSVYIPAYIGNGKLQLACWKYIPTVVVKNKTLRFINFLNDMQETHLSVGRGCTKVCVSSNCFSTS